MNIKNNLIMKKTFKSNDVIMQIFYKKIGVNVCQIRNLTLCLFILCTSVNAATFNKNTVKSSPELENPLSAGQLDQVREIAKKVLANKKMQLKVSNESVLTMNDLEQIRGQIIKNQPALKNNISNEAISSKSKNVEQKQATKDSDNLLREIYKRMKRGKTISNEHEEDSGVSDVQIREKSDHIQRELDDALSSDSTEKSRRLQALADRLKPTLLSQESANAIPSPTISTITKHREE